MKKIFSFLAVITLMMAAPNLVKAGDLSEILADGVIKIAVPESFIPLAPWVRLVNMKAMT